jgi:hypothetical protein
MSSTFKVKEKVESESITFRIEKPVLYELRKEAQGKLESVNTLANQIFKKYICWYSHAAEAGMMYCPKPLLIRIMNKLSEQDINQIADEYMKYEFCVIANMLSGEYSISSFLNNIESWMSASDIHYRHTVYDNVHTYIIQHEMGKRWSYFFEKFFKTVFNDMKLKSAEVKTTYNTIILKVNTD